MRQWIWITWEAHRRTRELSKALDIPLFERNVDVPRIIRYPYLMAWTCVSIARLRPKGLVVQNPSVVLALWVICLRRVLNYKLVVDAHNEGLRPFYANLERLGIIYRYIQKKADLTIVTNDALANLVRRNGGNPVVLPDRVPFLPSGQSYGRWEFEDIRPRTTDRIPPVDKRL